tara:strand:- start:8145 stop:9059 length:915 start_codon:yes stop_codon:yes gene_type:complete
MKKILIFEYITGGGLIDKNINHNLFDEANIIIRSLIDNSSITTHFFCDYRNKYKNHKNSILVTPNNKNIIYDTNLINNYDYFLPICPETDLVFYNYIKKIYPLVKNMNISSLDILLATSDKYLLKKICKKNNIPNPDSYVSRSKNKSYILKDRFGCGCSYVEICKEKRTGISSNKIFENYIPGKAYSISLYFYANGYKVISINEQKIKKSKNMIILKSLNVNVYPSFKDKIYYFINNIKSVLPGLRGFIGFDIVHNNGKLFLIEINARYTTSMAVIQKCKNNHILDYIKPLSNEKTGMSCQIRL